MDSKKKKKGSFKHCILFLINYEMKVFKISIEEQTASKQSQTNIGNM